MNAQRRIGALFTFLPYIHSFLEIPSAQAFSFLHKIKFNVILPQSSVFYWLYCYSCYANGRTIWSSFNIDAFFGVIPAFSCILKAHFSTSTRKRGLRIIMWSYEGRTYVPYLKRIIQNKWLQQPAEYHPMVDRIAWAYYKIMSTGNVGHKGSQNHTGKFMGCKTIIRLIRILR